MERKTFDEIIAQAYMEYLFGMGMYSEYYNAEGEFDPCDTLNRNAKQVPNGTWRRLLFKHLNKHFYN